MANFKELVRIGRDAQTRYTQGGKAVTGFSVAYDNGWGDNKQTVWLDCSIWGERGEKVAASLTKGTQIVVEGDIGTREHDGKTYVTLNVRDVTLVGGRGEGGGRAQSPTQRQAPQQSAGDDFPDDAIPF